jgi:membrane-associated phospholipid phosphatase
MDEIMTAGFLVFLLVLSSLRGAPIFEPVRQGGLTIRALEGAACLLILLLAGKGFGWRALTLRQGIQSFAEYLPYLVALMVYESLKHLHATALTVWLGIHPRDAWMMAADNAIFGKTPYLWLAQWGMDGPAFISVMGFFYSLYYVAPVAALVWFMIAGDMERFRLIRRGVLIALYGGYCFYILIPVAGPLQAYTAVNPLFFDHLSSYGYLMDHFRYSFDCFPSLHTAIPWLLVLLCHNKLQRWLLAIAVIASAGVTLSTIALRFHYGVDVIAGLGWAWMAARLARLSFSRKSAQPAINRELPEDASHSLPEQLIGTTH